MMNAAGRCSTAVVAAAAAEEGVLAFQLGLCIDQGCGLNLMNNNGAEGFVSNHFFSLSLDCRHD